MFKFEQFINEANLHHRISHFSEFEFASFRVLRVDRVEMLLKRMTSWRMTGRVHAHVRTRRMVVPPRILSVLPQFKR